MGCDESRDIYTGSRLPPKVRSLDFISITMKKHCRVLSQLIQCKETEGKKSF